MAVLNFTVIKSEPLPPDERKAGDIFARLGYRFADAIADLVDNSVDAEATLVHLRFVHSAQGIHRVIIADNGLGMSDSDLKEAMRFGSRTDKAAERLGKYGIGLKSASLSQAETVTVLSRQGKHVCGRRWTLQNVKKNWSCEILNPANVRAAFETSFGGLTIAKSGTVVIWEDLEHLKALPSNVDKVLAQTIRELRTELGIRFHRFIESDRLTISIDQQLGLEEPTGILTFVEPMDPFGYDVAQAPNSRYPLRLPLKLDGHRLNLECHIWPAKSKSPNYRLGGGKVALRQGFYFYRNDRVIQAGGWNQLRADDGEPHFSLARVKIDLPAVLDSKFKLDVTKSRLDPPPEFATALMQAEGPDGITFNKYLAHAEGAYRKQKTQERARFPVVPGSGVPAKARAAIEGILRENGTKKPTKVAIRWEKLDPDEMIRVETGQRTILLNSSYKAQLKEGGTADAPVLKVALMFLLQDELGKAFMTRVSTDRLQRINQALIAALKS